MNNDLRKALESNKTVLVTFTTKVGHTRIMNCTRMLEVIAEGDQLGINTAKLNGPDICCVYDWLVEDWRAFRWDSVKEWRIAND